MKRNFRLTLYTTAALVLFAGCGDKFLNIAPQGAITEEEIRNNPRAAQDLVNGVYNIMWIGGFEPDINSLQFIVLTEIASDNADKGSTPTDYPAAAEVDNFTLDARNGIVSNVWKGHYQGIARANQALEKIPLSPLPAADKNALLGEVRFLRAHFYFNLVRLFGGVPKIDRVPAASEVNSDQFQTRASVDTIYQLIIDDLTFAANNLELKGATDVGRATKGAAQGLLAKVYLYRRNWQMAFDMAQAVINSGLYDTLPNYANIWRVAGANSSESLFEVQTGTNAACNAAINIYSVSQGPRAGGKRGWTDLGFGFNNPTQSLVNAYEPGDRRLPATVINVAAGGTVLWDGFRIPGRDSVENDRYNYKAYHSRTQEPYCGVPDRMPKNHRVLRYADVLLIYAEAANELSNMGEATAKLNMVRRRAGLPNFSGDQAAMRLKIWDERRVELAMEFDRFFDIVRQGRAGQIMRAHGKAFQDNKHELFPIPQDQRDLSGNRLGQNQGYN
ncbi:RagB/SusD family nutrient uptake outer membrane protein [Chitinophaga horti]|uniref:RagB/SusD family nutrient uptake outer membrane protein n=1 Tax=Chitinophaga horti TaxID=2920382 RepID=A0ABY6IWY3_9BACT|nr:RagB/SusD family nutrient uptake outer membrane protein [Chitinophaga horti]UYQ91881.1 RagB/SusD family nutrient uptake outer membrane protein [Chitinophaga horti]